MKEDPYKLLEENMPLLKRYFKRHVTRLKKDLKDAGVTENDEIIIGTGKHGFEVEIKDGI